MASADRNWMQLIEAYPDLFRPPACAVKGTKGSPDCGPGWLDLLEKACIRIRAALPDRGGPFRFTQVKEKHGTLRIYWEGTLSAKAGAHVEEAIALAEARSACTCKFCGKPGRLYIRGVRLAMACAEHGRGEPALVRPGFEDLHLVRSFGDGDRQTVTCRRYDRETDGFVEVDSRALTIEE
jgi:hypothetical protein